MPSSMHGHHCQPLEREHLPGGNDGFFHWYRLAVALFHLGLHERVRKIELAELLEPPHTQPERTVVDLPYEFGTVDTGVGPLEGQVVGLPLELRRGLPELCDCVRRQDMVSVPQSFDYVMAAYSTCNPLLERGVLYGLDRLVHAGTAVMKEDDPHMTVF